MYIYTYITFICVLLCYCLMSASSNFLGWISPYDFILHSMVPRAPQGLSKILVD